MVVPLRILHHQLGGVGVFDQEIPIIQTLLDQLVDDRQDQRPVGARFDRHPLAGDRRVAGTDRIDGDETAAAPLWSLPHNTETHKEAILALTYLEIHS